MPVVSNPRLGGEMVLSVNTSNDWGSPTWVKADIIMDNDHDESNDGVDATTRAAFPHKEYLPGLVDLSEEFNVLYKPGTDDVMFTRLETAKRTRGNVDIAVSDYPMDESGAKYVRATCIVTTFKRGEQIGDACKVTIKLQPSAINGGHHPFYGTVGA